MMPGVNPKQLNQMMKKMGMQQEEIDATEVIIRTTTGDIIIKNPTVQKVNMMGQISYQISGEETEAKLEISEDDVETVMSQASVSRDFAVAALEDSKGDIAEAILLLEKHK
jgi:nascent polypeptide-associated complex subunit alpha